MKKRNSFIRLTSFVATSLLALAGSVQAAAISGMWYGIAKNVKGNTQYDHKTYLFIANAPEIGPNHATYVYTDGTTCKSELFLESVQNEVWAFIDESQNCVGGGGVRITLPYRSPGILFQWLFSSGNVDTQGVLYKVVF